MPGEKKRIDLDALQKDLNVPELLKSVGIEYRSRREGTELVLRCINPEHKDATPSLHMNARNDEYNGVWVCKPCGARGNVFTILQKTFSIEFKQALSIILGCVGSYTTYESFDRSINDRLEALSFSNSEEIYEPVDIDFSYNKFKYQLKWNDNKYEQYLRNRRISPEIAYEYGIGWSNYFTYKSLVVPDTIVSPVYFKRKLCSFFLRSVSSGVKLYPPNAPNRYFLHNIDNVIPGRPTIVQEGLYDNYVTATACHFSKREYNIVAAWSNNPTPEHIEQLRNIDGELILMPDRDSEYGMRMCDIIGDALVHEKELSLALIPLGNDPGSCTYFDIINSLDTRESWSDHVSKNMLIHGQRYVS